MIVWLASYPRSGNGFVRRTILEMYGIRTRSVYRRDFDLGSPVEPGGQYHRLKSSPQVHFLKTHSNRIEDASPAIYLVRDGRDSLVSYAWYALTVDREADPQDVSPDEFRETLYNIMVDRRSEFGTWSDNVDRWLERPRTYVLRFEHLIREPAREVAAAFRELDLDFAPRPGTRPPRFDELSRKKPKIYRRGKVGSWQDEFPTDLLDVFWQHHGHAMRRLGYGRSDPRFATAVPPARRLAS